MRIISGKYRGTKLFLPPDDLIRPTSDRAKEMIFSTLNSILSKKKLIFANEGRLLKKSFFGLLILALAFQGGEFGEIIRNSMIDAYIQVSVFVGFTLFVFIGLDSLTKFDVKLFLLKTQKI